MFSLYSIFIRVRNLKYWLAMRCSIKFKYSQDVEIYSFIKAYVRKYQQIENCIDADAVLPPSFITILMPGLRFLVFDQCYHYIEIIHVQNNVSSWVCMRELGQVQCHQEKADISRYVFIQRAKKKRRRKFVIKMNFGMFKTLWNFWEFWIYLSNEWYKKRTYLKAFFEKSMAESDEHHKKLTLWLQYFIIWVDICHVTLNFCSYNSFCSPLVNSILCLRFLSIK